MKITRVGLDLAKNVFQVHGVNEAGRAVLRKKLRRDQLLPFFANLQPCLIGMEACSGAHHWARQLQSMGHTVRLMAPQFVKPYVKSNKNDVADAEAICEAVGRPTMRFVPVKDIEQQSVLSLHRARQGFMKARTAQANQLRGLMAEYGLILPKGVRHLSRVPELIEDASNDLPGRFRVLISRLYDHLKVLDAQVHEIELEIKRWHRENPVSCRLEAAPGVGPLTASAVVASVGDAREFANGRQFAAWLGIVPRQHSSGGKPRLLGISKRGDAYLRTLLIHGARSVLRVTQNKVDQQDSWVMQMVRRRNKNVASVAQANKTARILWAMLAHDRHYQADFQERRMLAAS